MRQYTRFFRIAIPALIAGATVAQLMAQGIHPGYSLTSLRPPGLDPRVSGLDFLPDGRLVVSIWDGFGAGKGSVLLITNAQTGDAAKVTWTTFAGNLNEPLGVKVVAGEIYVLQKDQLSLLPDKNGDGVADEVKKIASGWTVQPGSKNLEFAMGMVWRDSVFYGGLAAAWPLTAHQSDERGCIIRISPKTGGFTPFACGTRTPDGMVLGPENELFVTENQGNWVPSSKLLNVRQGRFFGVHKTIPGPFDQVPETPPVLWLDHGTIGVSPTQPVYLQSGIYQGQMIAGDANFGTLQRYFLEKVNGEYQGCVFRFSGGLEAAAHRIVTGPDGAMYIGGIGTPEWGGWQWSSRDFGLQRMAANGMNPFDLLAVRSRGATTLELEFTQPAGQGADQTANYQAKQWSYIPEEAYGAGKQAAQTLTVQSAKLSADKLKVTLEIAGMKEKHVVHLKLAGVNSAEGGAPWSTEAWYTQNSFGPGLTVGMAVKPEAGHPSRQGGLMVRSLSRGKIGIRVASPGAFRIEIRNALGKVLETRIGSGPANLVAGAGHAPGIYLVTLTSANSTGSGNTPESVSRLMVNP